MCRVERSWFEPRLLPDIFISTVNRCTVPAHSRLLSIGPLAFTQAIIYCRMETRAEAMRKASPLTKQLIAKQTRE